RALGDEAARVAGAHSTGPARDDHCPIIETSHGLSPFLSSRLRCRGEPGRSELAANVPLHRPRASPLHDSCQRGTNRDPGRQRAATVSVMRAGDASSANDASVWKQTGVWRGSAAAARADLALWSKGAAVTDRSHAEAVQEEISDTTGSIVLARSVFRIDAGEQHDHGTRCRRIGLAADRGSPLPVDDIVRRIEEGVDPSAPSRRLWGGLTGRRP